MQDSGATYHMKTAYDPALGAVLTICENAERTSPQVRDVIRRAMAKRMIIVLHCTGSRGLMLVPQDYPMHKEAPSVADELYREGPLIFQYCP